MKYTENAINIVKKYTPCQLQAYRNTRGVWAIGYGHTHNVKPMDTLESEEQASILLDEDATNVVNFLENLINTGRCTFIPNQNEIDALVSFGLDRGVGTMGHLAGSRNEKLMADAFLAYDTVDDRVVKELKQRRNDERSLFISNDN